MFDIYVVILFAVVAGLVYSSLKRLFTFWDNRNLPKGPFFSPFLGPGSSQPIYIRLTNFAQKFGSIYSYTSFGQNVVVLNDVHYINRILFNVEESASSRPYLALEIHDGEHHKALKADTRNVWHGLSEFRKDFLKGYDLRSDTEDEAAYLVSAIHEIKNGPVDIEALLRKAATNIICQLVFGRRFEYTEDRYFQPFGRIAFQHAKPINGLKWIGVNPIMIRCLSRLRKGVKEERLDREEIGEFFWTLVKKCENSVTIDDCFVREFLKQQNPANNRFTDIQLRDAIIDIFSQIPEIISATLLWAINLAAKHPDIQEKLFEEVQKASESLPYTDAFIKETIRYGTIRSYTAHMSHAELQTGDYRFPAKTIFLVNYWAINRNNTVYKEPGKFIPERFLTEERKEAAKIKRQSLFLGFGANNPISGSFFLSNIVYLLSFLIREFKFGIADEDREKELNPEQMGWMLYPTPMNLKIATRQDF